MFEGSGAVAATSTLSAFIKLYTFIDGGAYELYKHYTWEILNAFSDDELLNNLQYIDTRAKALLRLNIEEDEFAGYFSDKKYYLKFFPKTMKELYKKE